MEDDDTARKPQSQDYECALQSMDTFIDVNVKDLMALVDRAEHFAAKRAAESLQVSQVMSQGVLTVGPETSMAHAAHLMISERISGLPVVSDSGGTARHHHRGGFSSRPRHPGTSPHTQCLADAGDAVRASCAPRRSGGTGGPGSRPHGA